MTVDWDDAEQTVLLYTVVGHWTWGEFYAARDRGRQLVDTTGRTRVNSIIDFRAGSLFPHNALIHFRRMPDDTYPQFKFGSVVIVEDNLFVQVLIDMMRRLNPRAMTNFYRARTLDDARARLSNLQQSAASSA